LDAFEDDEAVYLALELVRGKDLQEVLVQEHCDCAAAKSITKQLMSALAYIHDMGMVHRDVKPENVMVQGSLQNPGQLQIKLIDFGLAVECAAGEILRTDVVGTAPFMAPEGCRRGVYSRASDLWAAGLLIERLLEGNAPNVLADDLKSRLLQVVPEDRLAAGLALAHDWVENSLPCFGGEPLQDSNRTISDANVIIACGMHSLAQSNNRCPTNRKGMCAKEHQEPVGLCANIVRGVARPLHRRPEKLSCRYLRC